MSDLMIQFLPVGCGDAIAIRFLGNDKKYHNVLIDGGKAQSYPRGIEKAINNIINRKESLDLWIITHIHGDHVGGILRFTEDKRLQEQFDISNTKFWFNHAAYKHKVMVKENNLISVGQAIRLRDFLKQKSVVQECITNETHLINFFGATLTILSPDKTSFDNLLTLWKGKEQTTIKRNTSIAITSKKSDYKTKINDFDLSKFTEDNSVENASSISFLFDYQGFKFFISFR